MASCQDFLMGFPTKVQLIQRKKPDDYQFYINFPAALADALDFTKGEPVEWSIIDKQHIMLTRELRAESVAEVKKKILKS